MRASPARGGPCLQTVGSWVRRGCRALHLTGAGWRGAGGAQLPPGRGWESSRRASQLPGRSTPRCRCRAATSGGGSAGGTGGSPAYRHHATEGGGGGKWGAPRGSPEGGAGAFGGRAGSALAPPILTLSLPSPPGPQLLFCPGASPTRRPRRPPRRYLPPVLSPPLPGAPRFLPPPLLPSRIVRLGPSNGGQEAVVLLADCRGANPRPGATAARAGGERGRSLAAGALPLRAQRPPARRFRADRASWRVTFAAPRRGCYRCLCPPHSR